ncbi:MAG: 3'-5' exonuclease [Acidobacteria bacterium]|nr:3'-5' exonuclease [Acidobacteriota bacterium]MBK9527722.1 3'-5' exonuclease [Acidobacteriota bacterium]MBP7475882.1 3'-5' exonuclease [Pyrinomonadaceae bacterium]MBP9108582.1 3'-5' exonuclease [Pyrinomonadaceae bacterium]
MLKNPIPELALFFDMEWVPDAAGARRLFDLEDDVSEIDAMHRLWEHSPAYDAEKNPRPFLKYMFSRVVSIAFLSRKTFYNRDRELTIDFKLNSLPSLPFVDTTVDEAEIIHKFLYFVGERRPQLVGFNSSNSDVQVLIQRGLINEITAPSFNQRPNKPWEGDDYFDAKNSEGHLDLITRFYGGNGMTPRLDELAKMCGFPGKIDVKGDQVTELWLNRDITKIIEYNQIDVLNTYLVWLRVVYFTGKLSEEDYVSEQEQFREFLETESQKPEKAFISAFLDKWPL